MEQVNEECRRMIFETMITGMALAGTVYYRATLNSRMLKPFQIKWNTLMKELNILTHESKKTFEVIDVKEINNGLIQIINAPPGLNYEILEKHIKSIENHYHGIVTIENMDFTNKCIVKIINERLGDYPFEPVKLKEYQLFVGKTYDGENYIIDMNKNSHLMFFGVTGTGKTMALMMVLTNLIYNSSNKIEIHLSQIEKSETGALKDCKCVKFYGNKLEDVTLDLEKVAKLINYRSSIFDKECVSNIKEYNKYNIKNKMKRIYYVIEELSFFMPQTSDPEHIKELKEKCWVAILEIAKAGRSAGIHFLSCSQRSTVTNIPSDLKSQITRVTFTQTSKVDSQNAIECDRACSLKQRECLIYGDSRAMEVVKVPFLEEGYISLNKYVHEIKIPTKLLMEKNKLQKSNLETTTEFESGDSKQNENVEKIFYEDKRLNDDELYDYLSNLDINNNDNKLIRNKNTSRAGVIKGGGRSDNKER